MFFAIGEKPKTLKEQLLTYKYTTKNPKATPADLLIAYNKVKAIIEENIKEEYIKHLFYARFIDLKSWDIIGMENNNMTGDCARKIISRYIEKLQKTKEVK
jgi:GTPase SAR1 family protein